MPSSSTPKTFDVPLTVRFHEADRAGVAFFGRVFEYAHVAEEELLAAIGCDIRGNFDERGWGLPIRHSEADYRRPLVLGDRLRVSVSVHRLGSSSISTTFEIRGEQDDAAAEPRAIVKLTQVCVTQQYTGAPFEKRPLPSEFLEGLRRLGLLAHLDNESSG